MTTDPFEGRKILNTDEMPDAVRRAIEITGASEVALVRNPGYIYAPVEFYPLAPKVSGPIPRVAGVVKDMDGTTTTTEPLCLHSLEWMVGRVTDANDDWSGLDKARDYPHIIGNSTTKHVEYLLETYGANFSPRAALAAWIEAAIWTLSRGRDAGRRAELRTNLTALGMAGLAEEADFLKQCSAKYADAPYETNAVETLAIQLAEKHQGAFRCESINDRVRAAVDIYYMRYHMILANIAAGRGRECARQILGSADAHLIEPMPGVGAFVAAVKGLLGAELAELAEALAEHMRSHCPDVELPESKTLQADLARLGEKFASQPVPVAVVTSSIAYEAGVVLGEVLGVLRSEVADWPVSEACRERVLARLESSETFYDTVVTASDSSEIRLKPHRDLYSLALHRIGLGQEDYPCVMGFEDSESGVVAIRAAGVGLSVAVPFIDTVGHDLSAAAHILPGGLPQVLIEKNCFLN
jgi:phosphoglycolate phosphatase-like HAD superfamily hydrolase